MSKIKVVVSTHQGKLYEEMCDNISIQNQNGQFGILKDHIAICTTVTEGYVKLVKDNAEYFLSLVNGLVEFNNNVCNVVAQEAHIGTSYEAASAHLESVRKARLEHNRKVNADYTKNEKDIRDNLKKSRAGSL
ncbi:MAG: hypothetical protein R3Y60_00830 [bacterium]